MATVAQINTKGDEVVAAIEAGDFVTALTKALSLQTLLLATADSRQKSDTELEWDRESIGSLIRNIRKQQTAAAVAANGIRRTNIKYACPTDTPTG